MFYMLAILAGELTVPLFSLVGCRSISGVQSLRGAIHFFSYIFIAFFSKSEDLSA
jgi:hypothetical protein